MLDYGELLLLELWRKHVLENTNQNRTRQDRTALTVRFGTTVKFRPGW